MDDTTTTIYNCATAMVAVVLTYYIVMPLAKLVLVHFIKGPLLSRRSELSGYGNWAVVTGATDGIGKAYAEAFANDGLNVCLISRTKSKLETVANELMSTYSIKTMIVAVDFTKTDIYETVREALEKIQVSVLVNNVGMSYSYPDYFDSSQLSDEFFMDMINCNMVSTVQMTRIVLPKLISQGGGAIINVSSASGANPTPLLSVYSASKSFVDFFSRAVGFECLPQGVIFQSVMPFFVATKLSKIRHTSFFVPSPNSFVASALNLLGVEKKTYGCFSHSLQGFVMELLPRVIVDWYSWRSMYDARRRALRRLEAQSKSK